MVSTIAPGADSAGGTVVQVNRHIPRDWNTFIPPGKEGRTVALCGSKPLRKYCGIPGVTEQVLIYKDRPGWCIGCIDALFAWYRDTYQSIPVVKEVDAAYNLVFWEMFLFMRHMLDNESRLKLGKVED